MAEIASPPPSHSWGRNLEPRDMKPVSWSLGQHGAEQEPRPSLVSVTLFI